VSSTKYAELKKEEEKNGLAIFTWQCYKLELITTLIFDILCC